MVTVVMAILGMMPQQGAVSGVVFDSTAGKPLVGATVTFVGARDSVLGRTKIGASDSTGRYAVRDLIPGSYAVGIAHPLLELLEVPQVLRPVDVDTGALVLDLATPSRRSLAGLLCDLPPDSSASLVYGRIHDLRQNPLQGVTVRAVLGAGTENPVTEDAPQVVTTDDEGSFRFCHLQAGTIAILDAVQGQAQTGRIPVPVAPNDFTHLVLVLDNRTAEVNAGGNLSRRDSRLSGIVVDSNGAAVPGAVARVFGLERSASTDAKGRFVLDGMPSGTHFLTVRKLGFVQSEKLVHLSPHDSSSQQVMLAVAPAILAPVTVTGTARNLDFEYRRRRSAVLGHFMGHDKIDQFPPTAGLMTLIQDLPGVRKVCGPRGCTLKMLRMASTMTIGGRELCGPKLFVDGMRDRVGETDFDMLRAADIAAIEVYSREAQLPAEFIALAESPCGAIVVWTKARRKH